MNQTITTLPNEQALVVCTLTEPSAFASIYDHYAPRIYTYMRYRVSDQATADDLTAQTFERALVNLKNYHADQSPFAAWLFGIAHHVVSSHYRLHHRWKWLSLEMILHHPSDIPQPEDNAIHNEVQQQLVQAVTQLRDKERNLIALKFAGGLNNRQIASITGLSESNVGIILYRSINRLREILIEKEINHE